MFENSEDIEELASEVEDNGDVYLYSTAEWNAFETSGKRPACPLKRQPAN